MWTSCGESSTPEQQNQEVAARKVQFESARRAHSTAFLWPCLLKLPLISFFSVSSVIESSIGMTGSVATAAGRVTALFNTESTEAQRSQRNTRQWKTRTDHEARH